MQEQYSVDMLVHNVHEPTQHATAFRLMKCKDVDINMHSIESMLCVCISRPCSAAYTKLSP